MNKDILQPWILSFEVTVKISSSGDIEVFSIGCSKTIAWGIDYSIWSEWTNPGQISKQNHVTSAKRGKTYVRKSR